MAWIFCRYIAKQFLYHIMIFALLLSLVVWLFDCLELARLSHGTLSNATISKLAFLKNFITVEKLSGIVLFLAALLTLLQSISKRELLAAKASGIGMWQIAVTFSFMAFNVGLLILFILNPIGTFMWSKYETGMHKLLPGKELTNVRVANDGLWFKERTENNIVLVNAMRINTQNYTLYDAVFFHFDHQYQFLYRIDTPKALLANNHWLVPSGSKILIASPAQQVHNFKIATNMQIRDIDNMVVNPLTIPTYKLWEFINVAESAGFNVSKQLLYFYKGLLTPCSFIVLMFLAAACAQYNPRQYASYTQPLFHGMLIVFMLHFLADFIAAYSHNIGMNAMLIASTPLLFNSLVAGVISLHNNEKK